MKSIRIILLVFGLLSTNYGNTQTRVSLEAGWNYTLFSNPYLNALVDSSNAKIGRGPNPLVQKLEHLENPQGFCYGMSVKVGGIFRTGVLVSYKRTKTRMIVDHGYNAGEYHHVDYWLKTGNIQFHASLYPKYDGMFSFGISTELGRVTVRKREYDGPTSDVEKRGNWANNHTDQNFNAWMTGFVNIDLLAKKLYGIQIRPSISLPLYKNDFSGLSNDFFVNDIPASVNREFRPILITVTAVVSIGIKTDD